MLKGQELIFTYTTYNFQNFFSFIYTFKNVIKVTYSVVCWDRYYQQSRAKKKKKMQNLEKRCYI